MKYYYLAVTTILLGLILVLGFSIYIAGQKEIKQLEVKKLELQLKLKER